MLIADELTKREIADRFEFRVSDFEFRVSDLDYNDVHHFSNQFKKVTGYTPGAYKTRVAANPF